MKEYELLMLVHPDLEGALTKVTDKVEALVSTNEGKIINFDNWGKRHLAYPVAKQSSGVYLLYSLELPPEATAKLEREFKLSEEILRFMLTKFQPIPEAQKLAAEKRDAEAPAEELRKSSRPATPSAAAPKRPTVVAPASEEPAISETERRQALDEKLAEILSNDETTNDALARTAKEEK